ncbi:hypothetical protein Q4E93_11440 [Flavitalea sp. BT771]|uniref:hypothetical protein n=1 Tax=Flavitalea sp. BT771 TaxID=3063329 RepID=UPI0026E210E4|nr:hypothetical protein [Flavitalea sp. BT771]MDO6431206.1 hypothetical protein [Flavitalea sp. BT771]MDV6220113.1 hypothetical protein [Flavitalea sp. BT771]
MQKRTWKRIALGVLSGTGLLVIVLCVHIYIVTRPKPIDAHTRAMARIDIRQAITQTDADKITCWLYQQKGVDHVLVNPKSDIAVFTFFPIKTTASQVVSAFKAQLPYKAERFIPSEEAMKSGCPVASTSISYRVYGFFKHIF